MRPWRQALWPRAQATERKHLPLKDVAADSTTMLAVMSEPRKGRDLVAQR